MIRLIRNIISSIIKGFIAFGTRTGRTAGLTMSRISNSTSKFAGKIACRFNRRIRLYKFGFNSLFSYLMYGSSHVELLV